MDKKITFKGSPLTLVGRNISPDKPAPEFRLIRTDLKEIGLHNFKNKIKIITSFPSLDTPVCDLQIKEFNEQATDFSSEVIVLGASKDLPFAQKRFCDSFGIKRVILASDYKFSSFAINYGLLIKELNLLARAALIIDKDNFIRYIQIAPEISSALDYQDLINKLKEIISGPPVGVTQEMTLKCKPCEGKTLPLPKDRIDKLIAQYRGWELIEDKKLVKVFKYGDFIEAKYFLDLVSLIAQEQGHHPTMSLIYNKVKITLTTHAAAGLTENDFIMAKIIDELL